MATTGGVERDHMSDAEALMWNLETDPHLAATFANVTVCDRVPDLERLRARMTRTVEAVPRLGQRVVTPFGRLAPPAWLDDEGFSIADHVHRVDLPAGADRGDLWDLAASLATEPFDRNRPLWDFTVIGGLPGGRGALVQRLHHTITDGEGGVRMSTAFVDLERDPDDPAPVPMPTAAGDTGGETSATGSTAGESSPEHPLADATDALAHQLRRQAGLARRGGEAALALIREPGRLPGVPARSLDLARSVANQVASTDRRRSPLWTDRTLQRHFATHQIRLDDAHAASRALGGSVNDLFVAGAAGGAGAYHRACGAPVEELRMAMPVSTRERGGTATNAFAPSRVLVPVRADPRTRFAEIHRRLAVTKGEPALTLATELAGLINVLPTPVLVRVVRSQTETVDFTTSNVRGAPWDLYIAGARIEGNFPLGPLGGTAFNLTCLSASGNLDMGLLVDTGAIDDPDLLAACVRSSFDELLALA